ncbi:MAG: hypothetical protein LBC81_03860 [Tannerellaceae bacterium]|jgi:hypothetical protein|nr:hypothetical protein [Tannerellaceae bacterium]
MMSVDPSRLAEMVYSLIADSAGRCVYVGSHIGFGRYLTDERRFEFIIPESEGGCGRYFVNSLLKDERRKCIWVGTGNYLYKPEFDAINLPNLTESSVRKWHTNLAQDLFEDNILCNSYL